MRNVFFPSEALAMPTTSQRPAFSRRLLLCAAATMIVILAGAPDSYADDNDRGDGVQSWAVGHTTHLPAMTAQYNNQTIREIVHTSVGGNQVRVRISNTFGSAPLVIGEAHVAVTSSGASIVPGTDRALTFGGRTSVTIPAGAPALSDPVNLHVQPVSDIAVSIYLPNPTKGETTTFLQGTSFVSPGNVTRSVSLTGATSLSEWPFVSGVSVVTSGRPGDAIVAITDSATLSPMAQSARRTSERSSHRQSGRGETALPRRSAASTAWTGRPETQWGQSVFTRFDRDVLGQAGAQVVIVWIGLNDLAGAGAFYPASENASVDDVIAGAAACGASPRPRTEHSRLHDISYRRQHKPPRLRHPATHEAARRHQSMDWTSGVFDGVVDADKALRDPAQPTRLCSPTIAEITFIPTPTAGAQSPTGST